MTDATGFGRFARADVPRRAHPELDAWICRRILAGMAPRAVAAASDGAISQRTAYRWRAALLRLEEVAIGDWAATFAIRRNRPPTRISEWRKIDGKR